MSSFSIKPSKVSSAATEIGNSRQCIVNVNLQVEEVVSDIFSDGTDKYMIKRYIKNVTAKINSEEKAIDALHDNLIEIVGEYTKTEEQIVSDSINVQPADIEEKDYEAWEKFKSTFAENFWTELRSAIVKGSGLLIERASGWITDGTSTGRSAGENAFILVNPSVSKQTLLMSRIGRGIVTGAKYGMPVIGGVIDFIAMRNKGEETTHAMIKATAHVGIGIASAKVGAAAGAAVGSVVPFAGTAAGAVVGAVVGFAVGVVITSVGDISFDWLYDNHIRSHIDNLTNAASRYSCGSCYMGPAYSVS